MKKPPCFLVQDWIISPQSTGKKSTRPSQTLQRVEYSRNSSNTRQMSSHACDRNLIGQEKAKAWHSQTPNRRARNHSSSRGSKIPQNGSVSTSAPNRRSVANSMSESSIPSAVEFISNSSCLETHIGAGSSQFKTTLNAIDVLRAM